MRRATVNFWIDAVIAVAFLLSAATGILFLLPVSWRSVSATGGAAILGVSISILRPVHDWSGVVAAGGIVLHAALHLRWFVNMARRMARGEGAAEQRTAARRATQSPTASLASGPAPPARTSAPGATAAVVAAFADDDRRLSRRSFLVGLGAAAGAATFLGVAALLHSDPTSAAEVRIASAQSGSGSQGDAQGNGWGGGSTQGGGSGSTGSIGGSVQRVVVASAACVGCGRCLDVCPYGVFSWNGGKAAAQNPNACRLCRHCVQVCPAGAITLNG